MIETIGWIAYGSAISIAGGMVLMLMVGRAG
jgi:hypothetical protein